MRLGPIASRVPPGSSVHVRLHAGEVLEGTLTEIDEDCLVIRTADTEIILEAEAIKMVERRGAGALGPAAPAAVPSVASAPVALAAPAVPVAPAAAPAAPTPVPFPPAAHAALAELERRVRGLDLQIAFPEFSVYTDDLDGETAEQVQRDLLSVRNSYSYALKMKDKAKILQCVGRLRKLADTYQAPDCLQIAGGLAWFLGEPTGALDLFGQAAEALGDGSSAFDLAMAQRHTRNPSYPASLRAGVDRDSPADDIALTALTAAVLVDGTGLAELAGLVLEAAHWPPGPARLGVLHSGLLCTGLKELTDFPTDRWDAPDAPATAFTCLARALHPHPVPPRPARRPPQPAGPPVPGPAGHAARTASTPGPSPASIQVRSAALPEPAVGKLAAEARAALQRGDLPAAARLLAELKSSARMHPVTWEIEREVRNARTPARPAAPAPDPRPKAVQKEAPAQGPFTRAENALRRNDHAAAERLFRQAIESGDQSPRAVRKLATLLSTRFKKRKEALELLAETKHLFTTESQLWGWSMERSTVLEHDGQWEEALSELRSMFDRRPTGDERRRLVGRMVKALLKTFQREEAKQILDAELALDPESPLRAIRDQLIQAMETGVYSVVDALLQLQYTTGSDVSPLLAFHLERCEYRGVRAEQVAKKNFTEADIERLDELLSGRTKKTRVSSYPRERADYNLTAARILHDLGITNDRFRNRLRYFAAAMGDACALEAKSPDVIRAYYVESIRVKDDWENLVEVKLRQLVMSFTKKDSVGHLLEMGQLPSLEKALTHVMAEKHLTRPVLVTLLSLPVTGEPVKRLIQRIWADRTTRALFQKALADHLETPLPAADQSSFTQAWLAAAQQDEQRREIYPRIRVLAETVSPALTALDRHSTTLERIVQEGENLASTTDRTRIGHCRTVVTSLRDYLRQNQYVERERLFDQTTMYIGDRIKEYESAPTVLSLQFLHPYLHALNEALRGNFEPYQKSVEPESLKVELVVNRYLPSGGKVDVQLQVSNQAGASPVSNVELKVLDSDDYTTSQDTVPVAESLGAGESKTCQISMFAGRPAIEQELITLRCEIAFTVRSQRRVTAEVEPKSVRLHTDTEWTEIPNPFSAGLQVENPAMFKGRDMLIANLLETLTGAHRGSVIVYGQKRVGKSSVLYHLRESLQLPNIAVSFSVQDLAGDISFADFLYKISDGFHWSLSSLTAERGEHAPAPPEPDLEQFRLAAQVKFHEYMRGLHGWLRNTPGLEDSRLILLIDEFSMVHKEIRSGALPDSFMKGWKATLEKGFFRCVLVGNDLMPRFIQEFPNEFQVAKEERVSYLAPTPARQLIEQPIQLPDGSSRYRGNSVERILQLTGHSPYYIQLFCHELVQYMNGEDVQGPAIGPADVEAVADRLVGSLGEQEFDNLLTPGDSEVTDISGELAMEVLQATRHESGLEMHHVPDPSAHPEALRVIEDLHRREVLDRMSGNRYRIRVGLFSQWLQHRWG